MRSARRPAPGACRRKPTSRRRVSCSITSSPRSAREAGAHLSNSDPVTGRAAWFDVRGQGIQGTRQRAARHLPAVPRSACAGPEGRPSWQVAGLFRRRYSGARPASNKRRTGNTTQLALVIDLNVCVGVACVTSCKTEHLSWAGTSGSAPVRRRPDGHLLQPRADVRGRRVPEDRDGCTPEELPALRRPSVPVAPTGASYKAPGPGWCYSRL